MAIDGLPTSDKTAETGTLEYRIRGTDTGCNLLNQDPHNLSVASAPFEIPIQSGPGNHAEAFYANSLLSTASSSTRVLVRLGLLSLF